MKLSIDTPTLSQNQAWKGKRHKSDEYLAFEEEMLWKLPKMTPLDGLIEVRYNFHMKNHKMKDIDNPVKIFTDILVKAGIIKDDRYIYRMILDKIPSSVDKIEVEIVPYVIHSSEGGD
jgi:Holliday junction resolvase RusA-like endonuclease